MTRRELLAHGLWTAAGAMALGLGASGLGRRRANAAADAPPAAPAVERLDVAPARWRGLVSPEAWDVLFADATERPFTSALLAEKRAGAYLCAACFLPLFRSEAKFESGTGWPSFTAPIAGSLGTKRDFKLVLPRTEYHCARCGGHQGHVFDDGPPPTGLRYCNNGLALRFAPDGEPLPALRQPG
jgi:peptide-methionine (R)-S-oxide reductase